MKKYFDLSLIYAILAMVAGVYFREFTKFHAFTGETVLAVVHPHLFVLGTLVFLIVALFARSYDIEGQKLFRPFFVLYNIGLPLTAIMLAVRGTLQVMGTPLSAAANGAISGIAGLGHIILGIGIILLLVALRNAALGKKEAA